MKNTMSLPRKREPEKPDTSFWDGRRGRIHTRKGGWVVGEAVYNHGYSMMDDLVGEASFFQILILNVTGSLPEPRLAQWIEAVFSCMSWPDARIWCNQIGSLAGTLRATSVAAVAAGILATDSVMYGVAPLHSGVTFIQTALIKRQHGNTVAEIIREHQRHPNSPPAITGYARPIATGDERVVALKRVAEQLHFEIGPHVRLAFEIERFLQENFGETMNINGFTSAFMCDQNFSNEEIYRIFSTVVMSGVHACYAEAADLPAESFFPLHCDDIDYQGKAARPVPDA